ncbi:MAG: ribosome small subunit-dependent GTPase A [Clostridiales bacterium]|nr:ribosome small subunit-dependent GTPase A [Clostridiales bacterium]
MNRLGQVYRVHSNKYFVKIGDELIRCGARGLLKLNNNEILVGDFVEVDKDTIVSVKERTSRFVRPNVSNVDNIVAVVSPKPKPDYYLLDKLYINAVKEGVDFYIVVNKSDIESDVYQEILSEYSNLDIKILQVCAKSGQGIDELKKILENKLSVLAGQSAVGKSSIINVMFGFELKVGDLSEKIERGRHTTTRSEIFEVENIKIIDSPGFATIDANVSAKEIPSFYPEYVNVASECKFRGCTHINEPQCKVKQLVESGALSKQRYQRYIEIYNELQNRRIIYEKN